MLCRLIQEKLLMTEHYNSTIWLRYYIRIDFQNFPTQLNLMMFALTNVTAQDLAYSYRCHLFLRDFHKQLMDQKNLLDKQIKLK